MVTLQAGVARLLACSTLLAVALLAQHAGAQAIAKLDTDALGPNVTIFSPTMPMQQIQAAIDKAYAVEHHAEFGSSRYAFLFLPGSYRVNVPIGFYTQVLGLGATPDAVQIAGNLHVDAAARNDNATTTFWRAAEGLSVTPPSGVMQWAVSQAVAFRRMHVHGGMVLNQKRGWASGGWLADAQIDGLVDSGTQQQWISRNAEWSAWKGSNWNMVFVGVNHPPQGEWPNPPYTKIPLTPVVREKPFLVVDKSGKLAVRVPSLQHNSSGVTWHGGETPGTTIPLTRFFIAQPGISAAEINRALAAGRHLLFTPGIYQLTEPIRITRPDTVVLGLGFATLKPVHGTAAITASDLDGITIAGLLIDAGETQSPVLVEIGQQGSKASHASNPILLSDLFFRVGGAGVGKTRVNLQINSNNTLVDHTWIWRADHGAGVGWTSNLSANGLVVTGNDVTIYGLFVEHHQQYQVLWTGERGRTYFYQSEIPYDPPTQADYMSAPYLRGWASYKVADTVQQHEAWGLGIYSVFLQPEVGLAHAIEVPQRNGVRFHDMITVALGKLGVIDNVINNVGGSTVIQPRRTPQVTAYP